MINKTSHRLLIGLSFIICHLSFSVALTSCAGEEEAIFDKSAAERLNESSAKYSARLEAQPNGWAMQYYPTYNDEAPYGSGYLILMRFNPDFSVDVSMDNRFSNNAYATATSAWEVIKDNGPVLSFNTFNACMHAFSDPEDIRWTEDNEQSEGCGGDYEFIIVDAPEDASYMMLKGKKRNTYNLLTPVEVGVDYKEYLADVKAFHNSIFPEKEFTSNLMHFGDSVYRMDESHDGLPNIYPYEADAVANEFFNPFLITKRGNDYYLRFRDAFEKEFMEGNLQELRYDSIQDEFVGTDNLQWRITGYPKGQFFEERMASSGQWVLSTSAKMSDKMSETLATITASFKKKNVTYRGLRLLRTIAKDGEIHYIWRLQYQERGKGQSNADFRYAFERTGDNVKITYMNPEVEAYGNLLTLFDGTGDMMTKILSQEFTVSKTTNNFDLQTLRLTSVADPDLWFELSTN